MSHDSSQDQRKSYRCVVPAKCQECEVRTGSIIRPAKLLDESSGGFSILVRKPFQVTARQIIQLHTTSGWYNARVVHITDNVRRMPTDENPISEGGDQEDVWIRLGLCRLCEIGSPEASFFRWPSFGFANLPGRWESSSAMSRMMLGMAVTLVVVAASLGILCVHWGFTPSKMQTAPLSRANQIDGARQQSTTKQLDHPAGAGKKTKPDKLAGASPFVVPEVVERLKLNATQRQRIERIIQTSSRAIARLAEGLQDLDRQELSKYRTELLAMARRQAIELLTAEQRTEWNKIVGEP
jgi:hypothetical protein